MHLDARYKQELMSLGGRIKALRIEKSLAQPGLEALTGMRVSNISRIEKGHTNLKFETMVRLAYAFKVPLPVFFSDIADKMSPIRKKYETVDARFEDEKQKFGTRIEELTKYRNLRQDELAILSKIDAADISRYINGEGNIEF
jgi:transcriptional regulator with XRE-family HTH domain